MSSLFPRPNEVLFAVNSSGRVHYIASSHSAGPDYPDSLARTSWRELPYLGIDFKRVSAVCPELPADTESGSASGLGGRLWAIGGDHQVYVFAYGVEVPIRVKEVYACV